MDLFFAIGLKNCKSYCWVFQSMASNMLIYVNMVVCVSFIRRRILFDNQLFRLNFRHIMDAVFIAVIGTAFAFVDAH